MLVAYDNLYHIVIGETGSMGAFNWYVKKAYVDFSIDVIDTNK